jgi:YidC/Oxa1 family membrane protein insertase
MKQYDPNEAEDRARLMLAIVVSLTILLGFYFLVERPKNEERRARAAIEATAQKNAEVEAGVAADDGGDLKSRADVIAASGQRIRITGEKVSGSIALKGARLDDLELRGRYKSVAREEEVELLNPTGAAGAYYVENGWIANKSGVKLPTANTVWSLAAGSPDEIASGGQPVVLEWDNGEGLVFKRSFALDENYLFTVRDTVKNAGTEALDMNAYHLVARHGQPKDFSGFFVLHEGPVAFIGDKHIEPDYKDLKKGEKIEREDTAGWLGFSDKYWLVALLPDKDARFNARIVGSKGKHSDIYQSDIVAKTQTLQPGAEISAETHVYAGVKDLKVMRAYEETYGFKKLELGIDFGMWYFITKPFFILLHLLADWTGNIAIAILLMTVIVRAAMFPLTNKSFRSMAKMRLIAPKLKELQEKYKDDRATMQVEIYELYKKEDANPFSGCWPMLLQIPIVFALYKVILISVELRHAPFWGWIPDMSAPDPTSIFNLFGLLPFTPPDILMIGAWPVLFCISMIQLKRISPPMTDPIQEKLQSYFPYVMTVMLAHFASGLVIYWTWSNVLTVLQQYYILKKVGNEDTHLLRGHSGRRKKKKAKTGDDADAEAAGK